MHAVSFDNWERRDGRSAARLWILVLALGFLLVWPLLALAAEPAGAAPGDEVWQQTVLPAGIDHVRDVVMARQGDIWLAGTGYQGTVDSDVVVARYRLDGTRRWVRVFDTRTHESQEVAGIAVDRRGCALVTGCVGVLSGVSGWWTVKVSPSGEKLWAARISAERVPGQGEGVAVDADCNVYVAGQLPARTGPTTDAAVVKYSPAGTWRWARRLDGGTYPSGTLRDVVVDDRGRLFVAGSLHGESGRASTVMARYTREGKRIWRKVWREEGAYSSVLSDLQVTSAGVAAAGESGESDDCRGLLLRRRIRDGAAQVTLSAYGLDLQWKALAMNDAGDVGLAGTTTSDGGVHTDYVHLRRPAVGPAGVPLRVSGTGGQAYPYDVAISRGGVVVSTGFVLNGASRFDLVVVYDQPTAADWQRLELEAGDQSGTGVVLSATAVIVGGYDGHRLSLWRFER